jgi:leader peptidase (prepilin peptidase)/N-methyltransferase
MGQPVGIAGGLALARRARGVAGAVAVAAGSGIAVLSFLALPPTTAAISCLLGWSMLAIAVIDARRFIIPDVLSLPAVVLGLVASGSMLDPLQSHLASTDHLIGTCLGGGALWLVREGYHRLRGRPGLGLGDVKLAAAAGAWTGWELLPQVILLASTAALTYAIGRAIVRREALSAAQRIAFGVFLAPSIWAVWVLHQIAHLE